MKMSGHFHATAILHPRKKSLVHFGQETGWSSEKDFLFLPGLKPQFWVIEVIAWLVYWLSSSDLRYGIYISKRKLYIFFVFLLILFGLKFIWYSHLFFFSVGPTHPKESTKLHVFWNYIVIALHIHLLFSTGSYKYKSYWLYRRENCKQPSNFKGL